MFIWETFIFQFPKAYNNLQLWIGDSLHLESQCYKDCLLFAYVLYIDLTFHQMKVLYLVFRSIHFATQVKTWIVNCMHY